MRLLPFIILSIIYIIGSCSVVAGNNYDVHIVVSNDVSIVVTNNHIGFTGKYILKSAENDSSEISSEQYFQSDQNQSEVVICTTPPVSKNQNIKQKRVNRDRKNSDIESVIYQTGSNSTSSALLFLSVNKTPVNSSNVLSGIIRDKRVVDFYRNFLIVPMKKSRVKVLCVNNVSNKSPPSK